MDSGNRSISGGLILFGIIALLFLTSCTVLELTKPDFYCGVVGQNGKYCHITMSLFVIAAIFLLLFLIGAVIWTAFMRYNKPFQEK